MRLSTRLFAVLATLSASEQALAQSAPSSGDIHRDGRLIHADIAAFDQIIVYNRFGSFDPYGMVFALRRDISQAGDLGDGATAADCALKDGTEPGTGTLTAGDVRLKDCKRPRPLVLRANVGDVLRLNITNLLRPQQPGISETFCKSAKGLSTLPNIGDIRTHVSQQSGGFMPNEKTDGPALCAADPSGTGVDDSGVDSVGKDSDFPRTRSLSFLIPGIEPIPGPSQTTVPPECKGLSAIAPNQTMTCHYRLDREGSHLFQSVAAPTGGEGDGGSLTHGLFGALMIEPKGSDAYRSQMPMKAFDSVWPRKANSAVHARAGTPDYAKVAQPASAPAMPDAGENPCDSIATVPVAAMTRNCATTKAITLDGMERTMPVHELVHGDLNAVIVPKAAADGSYSGTYQAEPFREFTVIFHDELKSFYTKKFEGLATFEQLSGVRDGFGINYGASGAGSLVLANKLKIGPAANCPECMYEEFFLESWANGDPALLENFADDPSNVHHSYLNDRVVFRNFHAGPKETHVFHLHSHQWFAGNDKNRGAYLDSQTIGPQQGMSYDIYGGGAELYRKNAKGKKGWFETLGSGNRNRTPGDAIFHCHLYPHFAQGMWELWRVHDVLEDGTRTLPDGQQLAGLSLDTLPAGNVPRRGTPAEGAGPALWANAVTAAGYTAEGTPVPGLLPVPGQAAPLLPTYDAGKGFPGYPFYVAGEPGHRTPQAPMDIAMENGKRLDGGLGRHVVTSGSRMSDVAAGPSSGWAAAGIENRDGVPFHDGKIVPLTLAQKLALGDLTETYHELSIRLLPPDGTALERRAMAFHHSGLIEGDATNKLALRRADGADITDVPGQMTVPLIPEPPEPAAGASQPEIDAWNTFVANYEKASGYDSVLIPQAGVAGEPARFVVNGSAPRPGAPFADPCGTPERLRDLPLLNPYGDSADDAVDSARDPEAIGKLSGGSDRFREAMYAAGTGPAYPGAEMTFDPGLSGFRRFKASVVQFDMVVNKAGWHDPQARINVVSENAHLYKPGQERAISGKEEPFYFRAFSGDCIEFHHTNESPHKLGLDDFQAKVPTDTIGQHIHLVKFDVTSSDGSGNGFNYEDGTFAPDELKERIHAAEGRIDDSMLAQSDKDMAAANHQAWSAQCDTAAINDAKTQLWTLDRRDHPACFQTTVQRWFADPVLARTGGNGTDTSKVSDRTLRTVFTHDHFAPSNIQQHGFYNALLIEPARKDITVYSNSRKEWSEQPKVAAAPWSGIAGSKQPPLADWQIAHNGVGARARVESPASPAKVDPLHPDYREFALAIADFALLYDGKKGNLALSPSEGLDGGGEAAGLDRLVREARTNHAAELAKTNAGKPVAKRFTDICEYNRGKLIRDENGHDAIFGGQATLPPAQAVACEILETATTKTAETWLVSAALQIKSVFDTMRTEHGKPVYPPTRPEAISQMHHDPYLVNYRNDPLPLRVGETNSGKDLLSGRSCPEDYALTEAKDHADSIFRQRRDDLGDMANVFRSRGHGDPCTPILEAYSGERVMVRLIQGAQEVQHVFTVEGRSFRRNVDQPFEYGARVNADAMKHNGPSRWNACMTMGEYGDPFDYNDWFGNKKSGLNEQFMDNYKKMAAYCDNATGMVSAQEIGISEHFEVAARFSSTSGANAESRALRFGERSREKPRENAMPVRDSIYHFGTVDAQWNGAWGLMRTFADVNSNDVTQCLDRNGSMTDLGRCVAGAVPPVGRRLSMVRETAEAGESGGGSSAALANDTSIQGGDVFGTDQSSAKLLPTLPEAQTQDLSCPFIADQDVAGTMVPLTFGTAKGAVHKAEPVVKAVIAIEARHLRLGNRLNPLGGVPYDIARGLHDPDGLMLVPVELGDLKLPGNVALNAKNIYALERNQTGTDGSHGALPWTTVREAAENAVRKRGFIPYVQRIRAGDCLHLVVINALTETSVASAAYGDMLGNNRNGLRDRPGDALMPKITRLNTDRGVDKASETQNTNIGELTGSASLALTIPMSMMSNVDNMAEPVGVNPRPALPPATAGGQAKFAVMTYFAGTVDFKSAGLDKVLTNSTNGITFQSGGIGLTCEPSPGRKLMSWADFKAPCSAASTKVSVMGRRYCVAADVGGVQSAASADEAETCLKSALTAYYKGAASGGNAFEDSVRLRVVPHAMGALPVKSISDPISHGAHGLAGMVIVEPMGSQFSCPDGAGTCDPETALSAIIEKPEVKYSEGTDIIIAQADVTEFAMLWQDGLNIWDGLRNPMYASAAGGCVFRSNNPACTGPAKKIGGPVPDCEICDDSYDLGEKGTNYGTNALFARVRGETVDSTVLPQCLGPAHFESPRGRPLYSTGNWRGCAPLSDRGDVSLSSWPMPANLFADSVTMPVVPNTMFTVKPGAEIAIRIVEGQGRARQRAFVATGQGYQDMFPGFGSGHSTLVAPGKAVTAAMRAPATTGDYLWMDGPRQLVDGGAWGLMRVAE